LDKVLLDLPLTTKLFSNLTATILKVGTLSKVVSKIVFTFFLNTSINWIGELSKLMYFW
jgi:TRAP-type C4-dicarboxylate transport system permease small subunit